METLSVLKFTYLIPLLPLLGAAIAGTRWLKQNSHWPVWIGVGLSAVLSFSLFFGMVGRLHHGAIVGSDPGYPFATLEERGAAARAAEETAGAYRLSASQDWYTWIQAGTFKATAGFFLDPLTAVMLCVVTGIGFLITIFSKGYMAGESGYPRFFAYLGLFIFAMTILVMGNNFVMLYLGWEGVGLCSYLLIGYYYERPSAREAAKKAFLVNRIGDFGFGLGIMLIYTIFGSISYFGDATSPGVLTAITDANFVAALPAWKQQALNWVPFLLMLGAFGKSAQFPLYVWLPDAMEGPTPVSALIHAATMVTAGVYMIVRCNTLFIFNPVSLTAIAAVGAFTALFAATIALRQFDLKKVFAYSTISQLGFMFVGAAALAPVAGMFHLVTHAFFKALLFLSSGVVMHAMMGELDMRKMSGLKHVLPKTRWLLLIGCLALAGMIPLSGFWSKDEIVIAAFERHFLLGLILLVTAFLTAYYTFRLYFRVFEGPEIVPPPPAAAHDPGHTSLDADVNHHADHHNHEPSVMILPLAILALGAIFGGLLNVPGHFLGHFLGQSPSLSSGFHSLIASGAAQTIEIDPAMWGQVVPGYEAASHTGVMLASILIAIAGVLVAYLFHLQDRPRGERLASRYPHLTHLLEAKYWVDEIYRAAIVQPLRALGRFLFSIDQYVIDGIVWIIGFVPQLFGFGLKLTTQRGSLQGYALMMLLGVAAILLVVFLR